MSDDNDLSKAEKGVPSLNPIYPTQTSRERELHEFKDAEGYDVNVEDGGHGAVKLAKDGHTRLIPQPSDDPNDPLNWSSRKKNICLFIVAATALLPDYGSATGAVTLLPQAACVLQDNCIL